jgi:hypothetical protein
MTDQHWTFIAVAYGITVVLVGIEWAMLRRARRTAIDTVRAEHDLDHPAA